jgi:hypothetical protein
MNVFGAPDDYRSIVFRRLVALDYSDADMQAMLGSSSSSSPPATTPFMVDSFDAPTNAVPTGIGAAASVGYGQASIPAPVSAPPASSTSWLSGLGALTTAATSIMKVVNPPTVPINPATGRPYTINPATGLPVTSSSNMTLLLVLGGAVIWFMSRSK